MIFFSEFEFSDFKVCLVSEMKRLQSKGAGSPKRLPETLTEEEEDRHCKEGLRRLDLESS